MKADIEFISAGAGSGKTYKLTETLAYALESGTARPHAVVATTFTVKAATELRERARARLLTSGRIDLATALGQASVGTVNSVCGQWLQRFCFELGLPPQQTVLGEAQARELLDATLAESLDADGQAELVHLTERLGLDIDEWAKPLREVVAAARANAIDPDALRPMGAHNADAMLAHWPRPLEAGSTGDDPAQALTNTLAQALSQALPQLQRQLAEREASGGKVTKTLREGVQTLHRLEQVFRSGTWSWPDWLRAQGLDAGAPARPLLAEVQEAAQVHSSHPAYHADVRRYLALVFNLGADGLAAYQAAKLQMGAVDFLDQEAMVLHALRTSQAVRDALAEELDLVLVDEFQDTSPLQLALFIELAQLARRSVWVGDPKQAIYGFRGSDARLVAQVLQALRGWGGRVGTPLAQSRRSTPALVALNNAVFGEAFLPDQPPESVKLQPVRDDMPDQPALLNWNFEVDTAETHFKALGPAVRTLLTQGLQVHDKALKTLRPLRAGDIGVLCRTHKQIPLAVAALGAWGVPAASARPGLLRTAEALLVLASLRRLHDARDTVATALVLTLAQGTPVQDWLAHRLAEMTDNAGLRAAAHTWQTAGDDAPPLLARLERLRPRLDALTPREALHLAVAESHVAHHVHAWATTPQEAQARLANVEALTAMGDTYEQECATAGRPATVSGLLRWLAQRADDDADERAVDAGDAVTVLTYHAAKGLEWPVVVLTSLDDTARTSLWGVRARTEGAFDAADPLARRIVHFWPRTWGKFKSPQPAADAEASERGRAFEQEAIEENRRLLYVGMTRARDLNVLVSCGKPTANKTTLFLKGWVEETAGASALLFGPDAVQRLGEDAGQDVARQTRTWALAEAASLPAPAPEQPRHWYPRRPVVDRPALWRQPSAADAPQTDATAAGGRMPAVRASLPVGTRIVITGKPEMSALGTALHLCVARAAVRGNADLDETTRILRAWDVNRFVEAGAVQRQADALLGWLRQRWPQGRILVETPLEAGADDGTRLRGRTDLLVDTPEGWVLVDHKSNPGGTDRDDDLATRYAPQLAAYAQALHKATGKPVLSQWLYMAVGGRAVEVQPSP
jgi:ATP-dependent exoDNAse (exonuclease V) beta subunit